MLRSEAGRRSKPAPLSSHVDAGPGRFLGQRNIGRWHHCARPGWAADRVQRPPSRQRPVRFSRWSRKLPIDPRQACRSSPMTHVSRHSPHFRVCRCPDRAGRPRPSESPRCDVPCTAGSIGQRRHWWSRDISGVTMLVLGIGATHPRRPRAVSEDQSLTAPPAIRPREGPSAGSCRPRTWGWPR